MTPERWQQVSRIYHETRARRPEERAHFLDSVCMNDESLQREVESLFARESEAVGFLSTPAMTPDRNAMLEARAFIGRQLGPYTILSRLGAGGMAEVYRARDPKLGRDVAIKILPPMFSADPERLARFEREARLLASLNHPRIGAIYGLENVDGVPALILELVEGDTLAERLTKGAIPVRDALTIARQIAEALEAAHERGIVHRDLKPANVVLHDLDVKVLDFGLAKAVVGDAVCPDLSKSPKIGSGGTNQGVILGTAAYMSPEQARGQQVDKRTDIWAFGCVLYEMLTGNQAFGGATMTDTLAAVVEREPDWSALAATTPTTVQRLLLRCVDKDARHRLHDIADARIEIEDVLGGASRTPPETAVVDARQWRVRLPWSLAAIASFVAFIAVGALAWNVRALRQARTAPPRISRTTIASSGTAAVTINAARSLAITPDGTRVVYVGNNGRQLYVRPLNQLDPTAIARGVAPLNWVFVSPDGQWVGFVDGDTLKKVAITGGPAVTIAQPVSAATWAPNDTIIVANSDSATGLQRVSAAGGAMTVLTRAVPARGERAHLWPEMLPGGRGVLFTITSTTDGLDAAQVAVFDFATGTSKVLVRGGSHAHYLPSGHLVYTAGGTLRAVPFDLSRLETRETPVTVLPRLVISAQGAGNFVVAVDGTLAYVDTPDATAAARTLVWVDRHGREQPLAAPPGPYYQPRVSPDGTRVAVAIADEKNDIWVWDLARQTLSRRTFDPALNFFPVWTPDGRRLIFASQRGSAPAKLFWQAADGTGAAEPLGGAGLPSGVTPDGTRVLFHTNTGRRDLMVLALDRTRFSRSSGQASSAGSRRGEPVEPRVQPLLQTPFNERNGVVSRDGRWLAYESDSSGRYEIYVRPFPNTSARGEWLLSTAGGARPVWAPSGQELFYEAPSGALMAVRVDPRGATWNAGSPAKVLEGPYLNQGGGIRNYDVSADGRRFLMVKLPANPGAAPQIVVVQNWFEELKHIVPVK